jgi:hypothetical protein
MSTSPSDIYWATEPDPKKLAGNLKTRIQTFRDSCDQAGRRQLWARAMRMLYGLDPDGGYRRSHYVNLEGAEGEDLGSRANIFRAFLKSLLVMTTGSRPSFTCKPDAYSAETNEIVIIGNAWLDKCLDEGMEVEAIASALKAMFLGEGWLATTWDDAAGDIVSMDQVETTRGDIVDKPVCSGATRTLSLRPDEVIRDPDVTGGPKAHRWVAIAVQRNRWDLMAQYPEYVKEIRLASSDNQDDWLFSQSIGRSEPANDSDSDTVLTYEFYHRKSLALPMGRYALLVGDCIVSHGPLQYEDIPLECMLSDREPNGSFGYAEGWDLMAMQTIYDSIWMQLTTNRENLGRPWLFMYTGTEIEPYAVGGARLVQGTQAPEVIYLSNGGVESGIAVMELASTIMQKLTGLNDAMFGNASGDASGVALAQQQATATQFNGNNAMSYVFMLQNSMRRQLQLAQKFMPDEQLIDISGKNRAPMVKRFKASSFKALRGVSIELGSASMRTSGYRHVIANELLQAGVIQDPVATQTYLEMVATGRLEPALEGPRVRETQAERLMLEVQEGRMYEVAATMPHALLISRLATLIADPSMSQGGGEIDPMTGEPKPSRGEMAMQLVMKHGDLWTQMSMSPGGQAVLMATGQSPAPGAQMILEQQQMAQAAMMGAVPGAPAAPPAPNEQPDPEAPPEANPDMQAPQNAPQPGQTGNEGPAEQPPLPDGAVPMA